MVGHLELVAEDPAIFHHEIDSLAILQECYVFQRIAVDDDQVRQKTGAQLAEFVTTSHHRPTVVRRGDESLSRRESELCDEQFEVSGIAALRCAHESVVAARHDTHTAPMKLARASCIARPRGSST